MVTEHTILLVEDDPDDAEMTLYSLKKLNFPSQFIHINDGIKALQYLFENDQAQPTLILLDLKMPKVDGIEILSKLKSDPAKRHLPVVALISSIAGKHYVESFGLRPDAYLTKPVEAHNFLTILTEIGLSRLSANPVNPMNHTFLSIL